jgi:hypothetical protein
LCAETRKKGLAMSQPPDDPFYNSQTESNFPPQWQNRAAPRYPQQPPAPQSQQQGFTPPPQRYAQQGQASNSSGVQYPPQGNFGPPPQGPNSYPGQPNQGNFGPPQQGPNSYPGQPNQGFGPPPQGPNSYPGQLNQGFGPPQQGPNSYPGQPNQGFGPPPQGPNSYPGQLNQGFGPPPQGPNSYPGQPNQGFGPPPQGPNSYSAYAAPTFAPPEKQELNGAPFAGFDTPGPPVREKKSNKGWIAIITILVLILIIGGGGFAYLSIKHGPQVSTTGSKTQTGNGAIQTATPRTSSTGGGNGTVGQPLPAGSNWVATVTHVDTSTSSLFAPAAGNTFLEISVSLKNVSPTSQLVTSLVEFSLTDASGGKHTEAVDDSNIHQSLDASVATGKTLSGQIAFEVPASQHTFLFTFSYGLTSGNGSAVSWELTA